MALGVERRGRKGLRGGSLPLGADTFDHMPAAQKYDVVCPHCKKSFRGELIGSDDSRQGFKCPHCRLFVPFERAEVEEPS